VYRPFHKM